MATTVVSQDTPIKFDYNKSQVPSSLRLEPIRLATGNAVELTAGASIPATGVTVLNGSGQHVIRGFLAGEKQSFSIVQRLWRLGAPPGMSPFLIISLFSWAYPVC